MKNLLLIFTIVFLGSCTKKNTSSPSTISGTITTIAGNGISGYSGDGGPATAAELNGPTVVAIDGSGNVYIADWHNNCVRKITISGTISTVAGNGTAGYSGDGGPATAAQLNQPYSIAIDGSGNLYVNDLNNYRIRLVTPSGVISTIAGDGTNIVYIGDGGPATDAEVIAGGIAVDGSGNLYIADQGNDRIRKVTPSGTISTIAGTGTVGFSGDGGAATAAELNNPIGIAVDDGGNIYFSDNLNQRVRKITSSGIISTIAGNGSTGYNGDGRAATTAELNIPLGIAVDASGNIYFGENGNNRIRKVSPSGMISTIAGNGTKGYSGDGGSAIAAELCYPGFTAVDNSGNIYFGDFGNNRVRKVSP